MDLSFRPPDAAAEAALPAADMAALLAMLAAHRGETVTAHVQAALVDHAGDDRDGSPLAPAHGAFNAPMASRLRGWQQP